jgi:hypothetical protein
MSSYLPRSLFDQVQPETADPTYRASMLPIATYPNADGSGEHLGLAMPGMIQEPMNALMRLIGTPSHPGTFGQGPDYGSNAEDMRTLLETFLGGNATRGMGAVERGAVEAAPAYVRRKTIYDEPLEPGSAIHKTTGDNQDRFVSRFNSGTQNYDAQGRFSPDGTAYVQWMGPEPGSPFSADSSLSRSDFRKWRDSFLAAYPDVQAFSGTRISGAKMVNNAADRTQAFPALFSDNLPSLPGAVIAGAEKQPFNPTEFRLADLMPGQSIHAAPYPHDPSQFVSRFNHGGNNYEASGHIEDGTAHVGWIGSTTAPFGSAANTLGRPALRQWRDSFLEQFPDVKSFSGERISGSRATEDGNYPVQTVSALFSDGLPSLWGSALQPQQQYPNSLFRY